MTLCSWKGFLLWEVLAIVGELVTSVGMTMRIVIERTLVLVASFWAGQSIAV